MLCRSPTSVRARRLATGDAGDNGDDDVVATHDTVTATASAGLDDAVAEALLGAIDTAFDGGPALAVGMAITAIMNRATPGVASTDSSRFNELGDFNGGNTGF